MGCFKLAFSPLRPLTSAFSLRPRSFRSEPRRNLTGRAIVVTFCVSFYFLFFIRYSDCRELPDCSILITTWQQKPVFLKFSMCNGVLMCQNIVLSSYVRTDTLDAHFWLLAGARVGKKQHKPLLHRLGHSILPTPIQFSL